MENPVMLANAKFGDAVASSQSESRKPLPKITAKLVENEKFLVQVFSKYKDIYLNSHLADFKTFCFIENLDPKDKKIQDQWAYSTLAYYALRYGGLFDINYKNVDERKSEFNAPDTFRTPSKMLSELFSDKSYTSPLVKFEGDNSIEAGRSAHFHSYGDCDEFATLYAAVCNLFDKNFHLGLSPRVIMLGQIHAGTAVKIGKAEYIADLTFGVFENKLRRQGAYFINDSLDTAENREYIYGVNRYVNSKLSLGKPILKRQQELEQQVSTYSPVSRFGLALLKERNRRMFGYSPLSESDISSGGNFASEVFRIVKEKKLTPSDLLAFSSSCLEFLGVGQSKLNDFKKLVSDMEVKDAVAFMAILLSLSNYRSAKFEDIARFKKDFYTVKESWKKHNVDMLSVLPAYANIEIRSMLGFDEKNLSPGRMKMFLENICADEHILPSMISIIERNQHLLGKGGFRNLERAASIVDDKKFREQIINILLDNTDKLDIETIGDLAYLAMGVNDTKLRTRMLGAVLKNPRALNKGALDNVANALAISGDEKSRMLLFRLLEKNADKLAPSSFSFIARSLANITDIEDAKVIFSFMAKNMNKFDNDGISSFFVNMYDSKLETVRKMVFDYSEKNMNLMAPENYWIFAIAAVNAKDEHLRSRLLGFIDKNLDRHNDEAIDNFLWAAEETQDQKLIDFFMGCLEKTRRRVDLKWADGKFKGDIADILKTSKNEKFKEPLRKFAKKYGYI